MLRSRDPSAEATFQGLLLLCILFLAMFAACYIVLKKYDRGAEHSVVIYATPRHKPLSEGEVLEINIQFTPNGLVFRGSRLPSLSLPVLDLSESKKEV